MPVELAGCISTRIIATMAAMPISAIKMKLVKRYAAYDASLVVGTSNANKFDMANFFLEFDSFSRFPLRKA